MSEVCTKEGKLKTVEDECRQYRIQIDGSAEIRERPFL